MKIRNILILAILGIAISSQAQDYKSAIGLRLGYPTSASFKTFINDQDALEFILGFRSYTGIKFINLGGLFQHHTQIETAEGLSWYIGGGANAFIWSANSDYKALNSNYSSFSFGITGCIGLDYKFNNTPLNMSIDWLPTFIIGGSYDGFDAAYFAFAVRYVLK